jgi:hypothetical protein
MLSLISCEEKGTTRQRLIGNESNLPPELKGLKVYRVSCGDGDFVKVAILDNQSISTTYKSGKHAQSLVLITKEVEYGTGEIPRRPVNIESIISENDSIMIIRKSD